MSHIQTYKRLRDSKIKKVIGSKCNNKNYSILNFTIQAIKCGAFFCVPNRDRRDIQNNTNPIATLRVHPKLEVRNKSRRQKETHERLTNPSHSLQCEPSG